ncbi:unnamed protein product [Somion occarium]|uniref:C2H2-type domain-containing protein n=1 Tax=Somion occarium TaxID=3059160 RepID=A0ABP1DLK9_9APHY
MSTNTPTSYRSSETSNPECPVCQEHFGDLHEHLWQEHKEGTGTIKKGRKARTCPWPGCDLIMTLSSSLKDHFARHTGIKVHYCPHVVTSPSTKEQALCARRAGKPSKIERHRKKDHGFNLARMDSVDPWVTDRVKAKTEGLASVELLGGNISKKDVNRSATARRSKPVRPAVRIPGPSRFQVKSEEDEKPPNISDVLAAIYKMNNGPLLTMKSEPEDEDIWLNTELHKKPAE